MYAGRPVDATAVRNKLTCSGVTESVARTMPLEISIAPVIQYRRRTTEAINNGTVMLSGIALKTFLA